MNKKTKRWLLAAGIMTALGLVLFAGAMCVYQWDFHRLSTTEYETSTYPIHEEFKRIEVRANTADIIFIPSKDKVCTVVCHEEQTSRHRVSVENDTLTIVSTDTRKWYNYIGINFDETEITVYLPDVQYTALTVACSTGDVSLQDVSAEEISLHVTTGDTLLTNVSCRNLYSAGSTCDLAMQNVIAQEAFRIELDTGDVTFERCDAERIFVETDTGDVTGSLLSEKVFLAESDTGRIRVPDTISGGICEIETDTGDIEITLK